MLGSCKELNVSGVSLIFRIHFSALHMLTLKCNAIVIISFAFFKNILLLFWSPLSCSFTFLNKFLFLIPSSKYRFIGFCAVRLDMESTSYAKQFIQVIQKSYEIIIDFVIFNSSSFLIVNSDFFTSFLTENRVS